MLSPDDIVGIRTSPRFVSIFKAGWNFSNGCQQIAKAVVHPHSNRALSTTSLFNVSVVRWLRGRICYGAAARKPVVCRNPLFIHTAFLCVHGTVQFSCRVDQLPTLWKVN